MLHLGSLSERSASTSDRFASPKKEKDLFSGEKNVQGDTHNLTDISYKDTRLMIFIPETASLEINMPFMSHLISCHLHFLSKKRDREGEVGGRVKRGGG